MLIHEATFEDALTKDAFEKRHSTSKQAMDLASRAKPWRTVLTHFSPRYQKIAEISEHNFENKTMVAFDHMRLKLKHFEYAYELLELYKKLFKNDEEKPEP